MASFKAIMDALDYEVERQTKILRSGGEIFQETRLFDEEKKVTVAMRSKEDAPDYRYFPDPDLVEIEIDQEFIGKIKNSITELPDQKVNRIIEEFGIPKNEALILTKDKNVSDFFQACGPLCQDGKALSRWVIKELFKLLNNASLPIEKCPVSPEAFSQLLNLITKGVITDKIGRTVLEEMFKPGDSPEAIIEKRGLIPIQDAHALEKILDEVMVENPRAVTQIKKGMTKPISFLIGQVMKKTDGRAHARKVREINHQKLLPQSLST